MLVAAIVLGGISSFGNAILSACIGYFTFITQDQTMFYKVLLASYATATAVSFLTRYDNFFDKNLPYRAVNAVRLFVPTTLLTILAACLALVQTEAGILGIAVGFGLAAGSLGSTGAMLVGVAKSEHLGMVWLGFSTAAMVTVSIVHLTDFEPESSIKVVQVFFFVCAAIVLLATVPLAVLHFSGKLDDAYSKAAEASTALSDSEASCTVGLLESGADGSDDHISRTVVDVVPWIQGINIFMTVLVAPFLPFLCTPSVAQALMLWKMLMDFLGSLIVLAFPVGAVGVKTLASLVGVRVLLLTTVFAVLIDRMIESGPTSKASARLVIPFDILFLTGIIVSALADVAGDLPRIHRRELIRRNRFAYNLGISASLLVSGCFLVFRGHFSSPLAISSSSCPTCVDAVSDEKFALQVNPCGSPRAGPHVNLFHFGANMGCDKLSMLGIHPAEASAARVLDHCLRFGTAPGVPTSEAEPGFGTLIAGCGGCVHGIVHSIAESDLATLKASEPGYKLVDLQAVRYDGSNVTAKAFVMAGEFTSATPSERYAGLVYCEVERSLAPRYADQLACELKQRHDVERPTCRDKEYQPITDWE
eukprot:gnl/TRDRNA2_/TRDRNA2_83570_c0_seq1.p1 gnl/TRDRNA2_/TRDRNA2_83570_c0~~gnl/TRDRNA2_/TRDRNA2_83570_c0_seq1.p1  ORF type:complete len:591 (-),score=92.14 gnl/TRDRNA2_/TRDRNA2_83570_c0_seq1:33-1805(-)